jgi:hypothetical protein
MAEQLRKAVALTYEAHCERLRLNLKSLDEFIDNHGLTSKHAGKLDEKTLQALSAYLTAATRECAAVEILRDVAVHASTGSSET